MLVRPRVLGHQFHLGSGYILGVNAANAHAFAMNLQHDLRGLLAALVEEFLDGRHDKLHGRVVVIEKHDLVHGRRLDLRLFLLEYGAVA